MHQISFGQQKTVEANNSSLMGRKTLSQHEYWNIGMALLKDIDSTKDSIGMRKAFYRADSLGKAYINSYPDKQQGYYIRVKAAEKADRDTSQGLAVEPIKDYVKFLEHDTALDSKKAICYNLFYLFVYNFYYGKSTSNFERYKKASDIASKIVQISPDHNDGLYIFAQGFLDKLRVIPGVY